MVQWALGSLARPVCRRVVKMLFLLIICTIAIGEIQKPIVPQVIPGAEVGVGMACTVDCSCDFWD